MLATTSATAPAHALEGDTWSFSVGSSLNYDDNLLRLDDGVSPEQAGVGDRPRDSLISSATARARLDLPVSRQRLRAGVAANAFRYSDYSYLNWEGVDYNAAWLWEVGNRWKGTLGYDHRELLSGLADFQARTQNLRSIDVTSASADYALGARWHLTGGATLTQIENSASTLASTDVDEYAFGGGIKYISRPENTLTLGMRYTQGDYPNRSAPSLVGDTSFDQYDYGVDGTWQLTGLTTLTGRVGYTQRSFPNLAVRDFDGVTGRLQLAWQATGKTGVTALARREIGGVEDVTATYIVTTAGRIAPYWLPSAKVRVEASYEALERDYAGDAGLMPGVIQRVDRLQYAGLSLTWLPTRNWQVAMGMLYSTRNSNLPLNDFDDRTVYATVQFGW